MKYIVISIHLDVKKFLHFNNKKNLPQDCIKLFLNFNILKLLELRGVIFAFIKIKKNNYITLII